MSEEVAINSDVLKYVMSSSGYDASAFAKKIDVSKDDVENWLTGSKKPTLSKLKKISEATKYNLAVLLLEEAPKTLPKPKDYRSAGNSLSHKTLLAIRKARDIQALYNELGGSFEAHRISIDKYELSTDSEPVAEKERELLGIELKGSGETGAREVLKKCIKVLEQNGVLVLQRPMPIENCRGFSIKDKNPFIIAVSSKDDIYPRLFTLFHEYAHLILKAKDGALCIPEDDESNLQNDTNARIEAWCNRFAAGFLLPESKFKSDTDVSKLANLIKTTEFNNEIYAEIKNLSKKHMVSYLVFLIRLKSTGLIPNARYDKIKEAYNGYTKKEETKAKAKKGGRNAKPDAQAVNHNGEKFATLVIRSLKAGKIDYYDAVEYLNTNINTIEKLASKLG